MTILDMRLGVEMVGLRVPPKTLLTPSSSDGAVNMDIHAFISASLIKQPFRFAIDGYIGSTAILRCGMLDSASSWKDDCNMDA